MGALFVSMGLLMAIAVVCIAAAPWGHGPLAKVLPATALTLGLSKSADGQTIHGTLPGTPPGTVDDVEVFADLERVVAGPDAAQAWELAPRSGERSDPKGTSAQLWRGTIVLDGGAASNASLRRRIQVAAELVTLLGDSSEAPDRAARWASGWADQSAPDDYRRRCLELLLATEGAGEVATKAAREALEHPDPAVRLAAARSLGADGREALRGLALDSASEGLDEKLRVAAAEAALDGPQAGELAEAMWLAPSDRLAEAALSWSLHSGYRLSGDGLAQRLPDLDARIKALLAAYLGAAVEPAPEAAAQTEALLVRLLVDSSCDVQVAAADALGRVGSLAAIEHLQQQGDDLFAPTALPRAARRALAAIQARAGGPGAGLLSVPDDPPGGSLSVDQRGGSLSGRPCDGEPDR